MTPLHLMTADVYVLPQQAIWPNVGAAISSRKAATKKNAAKVRKAFGIK